MTSHVNVATAFLAGLVSFISPCVLPLIPAYLSLLTGSGLEELKAAQAAADRARTLLHALVFIAGFTVIFILAGLSAGALGATFGEHKETIARIGGAIIVILGLNMMGVFKIPALMMDVRLRFANPNRSLLASFLVGVGFAAGWSPCIGPILSGVLVIAAQNPPQAVPLLFFYSMGLAVPFFLTALAINSVLPAFARIKRFLPAIEAGSGAILVGAGIIIFTGSFLRIAGWFYQFVSPPSL